MKQQREIGRITALTVKCVNCGTVFVLGRREIEWYSQKMGWPLPKRCKECRKVRREATGK